jgi:hypothetical protein
MAPKGKIEWLPNLQILIMGSNINDTTMMAATLAGIRDPPKR